MLWWSPMVLPRTGASSHPAPTIEPWRATCTGPSAKPGSSRPSAPRSGDTAARLPSSGRTTSRRAIRAVVDRSGIDRGADRGRHPRLRQPGRRGQPQRRPHGAAAGGAARRGRRADRQPAVRLRACRRSIRPRTRSRSATATLHRRRRGVDDARALRHGQAGGGLGPRPRELRTLRSAGASSTRARGELYHS